MKKNVFVALMASVLLFSCSKETTEQSESFEIADSVVQKDQWKTTTISPEIVENQKMISHYEFDVDQLQSLVNSKGATYVWFDLGLNDKNQITFTATGENSSDIVVGQVASKIISTQNYKQDFSIFNIVGDVKKDIKTSSKHILKNSDAYQYLTEMKASYTNFEELLDQDGQRVERFGMDVTGVRNMLDTKNIHTLALFLGKNKNQKMTTVFIGKDKENHLLIGGETSRRPGDAHDFTDPCPNACD